MNTEAKPIQYDKSLPYQMQSALDYLNRYISETEQKVKDANSKIEAITNVKPFQPLLPYHYNTTCKDKFLKSEYNSLKGGYVTTVLGKIEEVNEYWEKDKEIQKQNEVIGENNQKNLKLATDFLLKLGLVKTKWERKNTRSYKSVEVTQEWVNELGALAVTPAYSKTEIDRFYTNVIDKINEDKAAKIKLEADKKAQEAAVITQQEKIALTVKMVDKYKLQFNQPIPEVNDVIDELAKLNKYLYLAYYLEKNRRNWNDGYSYAQSGLEFFLSNSDSKMQETDSAIYNDISQYFEDFNDGRVFRDCTWNYSKLYEIVANQNKELYDDWSKLRQFEDYGAY